MTPTADKIYRATWQAMLYSIHDATVLAATTAAQEAQLAVGRLATTIAEHEGTK